MRKLLKNRRFKVKIRKVWANNKLRLLLCKTNQLNKNQRFQLNLKLHLQELYNHKKKLLQTSPQNLLITKLFYANGLSNMANVNLKVAHTLTAKKNWCLIEDKTINQMLVKTNKMNKLKTKMRSRNTMMRNTMGKNTTMKWMRKTSGTRQQCASTCRIVELAHSLQTAILLIAKMNSESSLIIMFTHNIDSHLFSFN